MIERNTTSKASPEPVNRRIPTHSNTGAQVFREIAAYAYGRQVIGTTHLDVPLHGNRRVHLWTFDNQEHVLILEQNRIFQYWEVSLESLEDAVTRACDWLTEPPSDTA